MFNMNKEFWPLAKYRATLAHFHNHSFKKDKCVIDMCYHPRFGMIRCMTVTKPIRRGQEILTNYGYTEDSTVPEWYEKVYKEETGKEWYSAQYDQGSEDATGMNGDYDQYDDQYDYYDNYEDYY